MMPKAPPAMMTGPIANPSRPSVRFTAFTAPTTTSIANGIQTQPRSTSQPLKNGIASTGSHALGGCQKTIWSTANVRRSCAPNFTRIESPFRVRSFLRSSQTPMSPNPRVASITTHTYRFLRFAQRSVVERMAARITRPPIVGVPFFVRWRSGVSSRIVSPPCCQARSFRISGGPIRSEITSAVIRAMKDRNVR